MQRLQVGDLCDIIMPMADGTVMLSNSTLISSRIRLLPSDMVMVCRVPVMTSNTARNLRSLADALDVYGEHYVVEVVVASGRHAGAFGAMPSFWLRTAVPAARR
jgi:hypothetical protein